MKFKLLLAAAFVLILAVLWWIYMPSHQPNPSLSFQKDLPDSYMTEVTVLKFDDQGVLRQQLQAKRATHLPAHNQIHYDHPIITWFGHNGNHWQLSANHGANREGREVIDLWDAVRLHRDGGAGSPETTASTSALSANSDKLIIDTDKPVRIEQPNLLITGVGLHGDLQTGELRTIKNTQTTFSRRG